jgi:ArsR family transcriptional regulator
MTTSPLPLLASDLAACCSPLSGGALDEETAERLARIFRALGDRHRVRLLSLIAAADGGEACICDLVAPVGLAQPTISHHMKLLVDAGLVTRDQRGKWAYYRVVPDSLAALGGMLSTLFADPGDAGGQRPATGLSGESELETVKVVMPGGVAEQVR